MYALIGQADAVTFMEVRDGCRSVKGGFMLYRGCACMCMHSSCFREQRGTTYTHYRC